MVEETKCKICKDVTRSDLCDSCLELSKWINILIEKNPKVAIKFLKLKLVEAELVRNIERR